MRLAAWLLIASLFAPAVLTIACGVACLERLETARSSQPASCHGEPDNGPALALTAESTCHREAEATLVAIPSLLRPDALPVAPQPIDGTALRPAPPLRTIAPVRPPPSHSSTAPALRI